MAPLLTPPPPRPAPSRCPPDAVRAALRAAAESWLAPAEPHRDQAPEGARCLAPSHGPHAHVLHAAGFARAGEPVLATVLEEGLGTPEVHDGLNFAAVLEAPLVLACPCNPDRLAGLGLAYGVEVLGGAEDVGRAVRAAMTAVAEDRRPRLLALGV